MEQTVKQSRPIKVTAFAGWVVAMSGTFAVAAAEPTKEELVDQLRQLQEKVARLESAQQGTAAKVDQVDAALVGKTVTDVQSDADRRSQLLQASGFTAGYSQGKFLIQSEDGRFTLNPNVFLQLRYIANFRQESKNGVAESDDYENGFDVRRLKFAFDGNIFTKNLTYRFQWNTNRTAGQPVLDEGWVKYFFEGTPFSVRAGTFLDGWDHETAVSSKRQLAVERSVLHDVLAGGGNNSENYVQGVEVVYDDGGPFRASANYNDGFSSRNTIFTDSGGGSALLGINNPQWGVSGRAEYKVFGDWKNYEDFTALGTTKDLLVVGVGGSVDGSNNNNAYFHTVDVQWEPAAVKGLAAYAAYVGLARDFRTVAAGADGSPYDWGFVGQVSYLLDAQGQWEVFGRYSYTSLDDDAPTGTGTLGAAARVSDHLHEFTVGANYYLRGHAAKFTLDLMYLPNGSPIDLNGAGILAQPNDQDQFVLRGQFQLLL
ncbi:MAG: phosphate-selective porin family protein [Phycisphaerales bacterium]|nr:phosphate-selective porin family protein [Phycisphaerales bacterium]